MAVVLAQGDGVHGRHQVNMPAGNMDGDDAVGLEMAKVSVKSLAGEQVHGYGVAAEGIHGENVVRLVLASPPLALSISPSPTPSTP